jgi:hypothetical protein
MSLDGYANFKTAIAEWADRTDLTARIPDFIALAEIRIGRDLRLRVMEKRSQMSTVGNQEYYGLPDGFVQARHVKMISGSMHRDMNYLSPEAIEETNMRKYSGGTGEPRYYTFVGDEMRVIPSPAGVYTVEIVYYKTPDVLSASQTSNRLYEQNKDVYLYATLLEVATYLRDIEGAKGWGTMYSTAIKSAEDADARDRHSGGALFVSGDHFGA